MDSTQKQKFVDEVLDPHKVILYCGLHKYYGPMKSQSPFSLSHTNKAINIKPAVGCVRCWQVYFMHEIGNAPPTEREKLLGELERAVMNAVQLADEGLFDFEVYQHPEIKIEKGD